MRNFYFEFLVHALMIVTFLKVFVSKARTNLQPNAMNRAGFIDVWALDIL